MKSYRIVLRLFAVVIAAVAVVFPTGCAAKKTPAETPTVSETQKDSVTPEVSGTPEASASADASDASSQSGGYRQISQEEAMRMMERDDGHIVLDVRRQDEFDAGHIPGAVCIPNESIAEESPPELPDKDQIILVYCRSGRRSKEAAQKLSDMGYTRVYEFGGILTWKGEIVTENPD